jgi:tRNA threonylcarbamoyladenosine biosynthesis protein TsaB
MVRVLGIDTSTDSVSVALLHDSDAIAEITLFKPASTLSDLVPTIDFLLKSAHSSLRQIDLLAVTTGPGSWTGLRIGVATAKTIAQALNVPIIGIPTLDALARNVTLVQSPVACALDAHQSKVIVATFDASAMTPKRLGADRLILIADFLTSCVEPTIVIGNAVKRLRSSPLWAHRHLSVDPALNSVSARALCDLALQKYLVAGPDDCLSLAPSYFPASSADQSYNSGSDVQLTGSDQGSHGDL